MGSAGGKCSHHNFTVCYLLFIVPSTGPVILEAYSINKTTVFVRWNETSIPKDDWNGIPRGFRVHGQGSPCRDYHVTARNVGLNVSSFIVTGLKAWVVYVVKISGLTTPGHGVASEVNIKTKDSGNMQRSLSSWFEFLCSFEGQLSTCLKISHVVGAERRV